MVGYLKDKHLNNKNNIKNKPIVMNTKMINSQPKKNQNNKKQQIVINQNNKEDNNKEENKQEDIIETFTVGNYDLYESLETKQENDDDDNNSITPWIKSKNQNYDDGFQRKLDLFTGDRRCVLKQPKKEVESFAGGKDKQNIYGGQVYTGAYQQNMNSGRYYTNELPFEQKKITPGLGVGYDKDSNHGFQQNIRKYELPKTVEQLRSKTNPKISYKGKIIQGKSIINARDAEYNFTKFKNTAIFENRPLEKTVGLIKKNRTRPHIELYDSKRSLYNGELTGHETKGIGKGEYRSKINKSKKNNFANDPSRNLKGKVKFDLNRKSYTCNPTKREEQTVMPYEKKFYISNLLKALIPVRHYDDTARKTVKETTIHYDDKNILNLKTGCGKNTSRYTDKARKTVKETTSHYDDKNILNIKIGGKNTMRYKDKQKQTIKETTIHNVKDVLNIKLFNKLPKRTQQSIAKTLKECVLHTPRLGNPTLKDTDKKSYVIDIPKLETTLKETLIKDAQLLNVLGKLKHKVYLMDNAKTTHKETYADNPNIGQANINNNDGYKVASYDMIDTNRQSTSNKDYYGITGKENCDGYKTSNFEAKETNKQTYVDKDYYGTSKGDLQSVSYEDIYNATMNEIKETVAVGRPPTIQGPKVAVSADDVNLNINKNECINTRTPLIKTIVNNSVLPIYSNDNDDDDNIPGYLESTSNRNDSINDAIRANAERDTDIIVQQIESNPLHISII